MKRKKVWKTWIAIFCLGFVFVPELSRAQGNSIGAFQDHGDVGTVLHPGSASFEAEHGTYTLTGSGENMWFAADAFQFVWKKVTGDVAVQANIAFVGQGKNEHRKAVLMIRQSLETDSVYADLALHGSGMTSLQYREAKSAITHEIQSSMSAPTRLRIEKRGEYVYMFLAGPGEDLHMAGGSTRVPLEGSFYLGIGVCSHDKDVIEKAVFSNVEVSELGPSAGGAKLFSTLETVTISSTDRRVAYVAPERFEAPNWTQDGTAFLFNRSGGIGRLKWSGGNPEGVKTGLATRCNNDHGIS